MSKNASNNVELKGKVVFFATGNVHKFNEAKSILHQYGISAGMLKLKGDEIQSESLKEIAQKSVQKAYISSHLPIFVEDAGLFIEALHGFPGPYAAYVYQTISNDGILKLMENQKNRKANFQSVIAFSDEENANQPLCFFGKSEGNITLKQLAEQGKSGFGFDPIFQPKGSGKTFAEMSLEEKNNYSHRAKAVRAFAEWYEKQ
jgi:XTP/dITP diphosphohydrolase